MLDILSQIKRRGNYVTFAELVIGDESLNGDRELVLEGDGFSNIVLWSGMSSEFIEAVDKILKEDVVHYHSTPALTYLLDGMALKYPIVKSKRHYKKPHWAPVVFVFGSVANCDSKECKKITRKKRKKP